MLRASSCVLTIGFRQHCIHGGLGFTCLAPIAGIRSVENPLLQRFLRVDENRFLVANKGSIEARGNILLQPDKRVPRHRAAASVS